MRALKYHPHGSVLFITFSIEEGLLLLPNPLCTAIVKSCLACAQSLYPLTICHFLVEATHIHLIAVVQNPDDVASFLRHFKTESAHMLNRVLGRRKRTVWCEGYDSPIVLTPVRTMLAICYLYLNPSKDALETTIDNYPGLSSWGFFIGHSYTHHWNRLQRSQFRPLPKSHHNLKGYTTEAARVLSGSKQAFRFRLDPNAWLRAFGINDPRKESEYNQKIIKHVRVSEERSRRRRVVLGHSVLGRARLLTQRLDTTYRPKRSGQHMCCLSEDRSLRNTFIVFLKDIWSRARDIRKRWILGDYSIPYPMGLYQPALPKLSEPLTAW